MNGHDLSCSFLPIFLVILEASLRVIVVDLYKDLVVVLGLLFVKVAQPEHHSHLMGANLGVTTKLLIEAPLLQGAEQRSVEFLLGDLVSEGLLLGQVDERLLSSDLATGHDHGRLGRLLLLDLIESLPFQGGPRLESGRGLPPFVAGLEVVVGRRDPQVAIQNVLVPLAKVELLDVGVFFVLVLLFDLDVTVAPLA